MSEPQKLCDSKGRKPLSIGGGAEMFYFIDSEYYPRTFVKPWFKTGDNVCMVERDGERSSWSVYDGDRRDPGDIYDRSLGSFKSREAALDFVHAHYAPNHPVVGVYKWTDGYPIYFKVFKDPIGEVRKMNTKKWGVFIYDMGDEPVFVASTLKTCRESLKSSAKVQLRVSGPSVTSQAMGALTTSEVNADEAKQSGPKYLASIGLLLLLACCAAYVAVTQNL